VNNAELSEGLPDGFPDLLASRSVRIRQQQDKFLAAKSRRHVGRPARLRGKDLRNGLQTCIAGQVPVLIVEFESEVALFDLKSILGVDQVEEITSSQFRITPRPGIDVRPEIFSFAADKKLSLVGLRNEANSLETIFKELTAGGEYQPGAEYQPGD